MKASQKILFNLQAVRCLLGDRNSWTRWAWARDAYGKERGSLEKDACCWCAGGAIKAVDPDRNPRTSSVADTFEYFNDFLVKHRGYSAISNFNDNSSHEEVVAALDACIKQCAQKLEAA